MLCLGRSAPMNENPNTSPFTALRNPVYRRLWFASLLSGTCVTAYDCAAVWAMYKLNPSPLFLSLMSCFASLPFFLLVLPAGALVDIVDRRKLLWVMNLWLAVAAGLLAVFAFLRILNPYVILSCVFLLGVGLAFSAPAWPAVVPEIVGNEELHSATALGGLQLTLAGIIGPTLGGILLPLIGAGWIFTLTAICFLVVILAVLGWKQKAKPVNLPLENFLESFFTAIRYLRHAPGIKVVFARSTIFAFFIALIPALIPVVGLKELRLTALGCGIMFSSMAAGAVLAAIFMMMAWVRAHFSPNMLTIVANLVIAAVYLLMVLVRDQTLFMSVAALAGAGWTLSASELWIAGQRAMPDWARGRMNATFIMFTQGAMAVGGIAWGAAASVFGVNHTLLAGAALLILSLLIAIPLSINFTRTLDLEPAPVTGFSHKLIYLPQPADGPIAIHYDLEINRAYEREFLQTMKHLRTVYLRNGAFSWRLHEDLGRLNTFRIEIMVPSWSQYLLQKERLTKAERIILERAKKFHVGKGPIEEKMFICVNRELHTKRGAERRTSTMPTSSLNLSSPGPSQGRVVQGA
jgi:MFS family permease